jgi:hypothetical protein
VFFRSILSDLDGYYWLFSGSDGIRFPADDSPVTDRIIELLTTKSVDNGSMMRPEDWFRHGAQLITEIAPYVSDDWNSLFGFNSLPADAQRTVDAWRKDEGNRDFLERTAVIFENWDAAFWTFYPKDPLLLIRVKEDLATDRMLRVIDESYRERRSQDSGLGDKIVATVRRILRID